MKAIAINTDHITLAQAIKMAGLVDSGGQAKRLIRDGNVTANGVVEKQPGCKLFLGDRFGVRDGEEWYISD